MTALMGLKPLNGIGAETGGPRKGYTKLQDAIRASMAGHSRPIPCSHAHGRVAVAFPCIMDVDEGIRGHVDQRLPSSRSRKDSPKAWSANPMPKRARANSVLWMASTSPPLWTSVVPGAGHHSSDRAPSRISCGGLRRSHTIPTASRHRRIMWLRSNSHQ